MIKIIISGPAAAFGGDDRELTGADELEKLDGVLYDEDVCTNYLDEQFDEIGLAGGSLRIIFDPMAKVLRVVTEYQSPRKLTKRELAELVEETQGQWSDGIGEACFDEYADKMGIRIDPSPIGRLDQEVRVEQVDDGIPVSGKKKSPLFAAAKNGDAAKITRLLDGGENVNVRGKFGITPLDTAIQENHVEAARVLIERGADLNTFDDLGFTPLVSAATAGKLEIARLLLQTGADPNAQKITDDGEFTGYSALKMACNRKHFDVVKLLIEHGADVNIRDFTGYTPLMMLSEDDMEIARFLIARGADPNAENNLGKGVDSELLENLLSQ